MFPHALSTTQLNSLRGCIHITWQSFITEHIIMYNTPPPPRKLIYSYKITNS